MQQLCFQYSGEVNFKITDVAFRSKKHLERVSILKEVLADEAELLQDTKVESSNEGYSMPLAVSAEDSAARDPTSPRPDNSQHDEDTLSISSYKHAAPRRAGANEAENMIRSSADSDMSSSNREPSLGDDDSADIPASSKGPGSGDSEVEDDHEMLAALLRMQKQKQAQAGTCLISGSEEQGSSLSYGEDSGSVNSLEENGYREQNGHSEGADAAEAATSNTDASEKTVLPENLATCTPEDPRPGKRLLAAFSERTKS